MGETPFVGISPREIYDGLRRVETAVGQLQDSMKIVLEDRKRIRSLEMKVYSLLAGMGGALALVTVVAMKSLGGH